MSKMSLDEVRRKLDEFQPNTPEAQEKISKLRDRIKDLDPNDPAVFEAVIEELVTLAGLKQGDLQKMTSTLRETITGKK